MLNESKGNMYDFVTHTWNTVKGKCYHDCSYCYMKRWGNLKDVRFDEKELKTDLGEGNFIFAGSSNDLFSAEIPDEWILKTLEYCKKFNNKYLFQTKNPERLYSFLERMPEKSIFCTTIESNRWHDGIMGNCIAPDRRALYMDMVDDLVPDRNYVTIEPIIDFDLPEMLDFVLRCNPVQVNIGADSGGNNLSEPSKEKILELIKELEKFTKVKLKKNINRILSC